MENDSKNGGMKPPAQPPTSPIDTGNQAGKLPLTSPIDTGNQAGEKTSFQDDGGGHVNF
jgi:hypothetical protein